MAAWDERARRDRLTYNERALLDGANLPARVSAFLERLVASTTLGQQERLEVLREIVTHFEDGLRAGRSEAEMLREFGDCELASRLLSRARRGPSRWWRQGLDGLLRDMRVTLRGLRRNPVYSFIAILTLGLGIGANTAVFSVVNGVLLKRLPYPEPDRLVALFQTHLPDETRLPWSIPNVRLLEDLRGAFEPVVAYGWRELTLTGQGDPRLLNAAAVSGSVMDVFGVRPTLGRDIRRDETLPGGPAEVVVSHAFWKESLGGDANALDRTLRLSGVAYRIVGVAPEGFAYPRGAQIWVPGQWSPEDYGRARMRFRAVARLAPDATLEHAQEELSAFAGRLAADYPEANAGIGATLVTLEDYTVGDVRMGLMVLLGAVAIVLLIACVNVANLVLVRGANRSEELAVRSSLGATRGTLLRQLMVESLVLAFTGAALGVLLAAGGVRGLQLLAGGRIPRMHEVSVDGTVLAFAAGAAVASALFFGLFPALRLSRSSIAFVIRKTRVRSLGGSGRWHARSTLLATEVGLSLVLLTGAGLLLRSFARIHSAELGFDPTDVRQFTVTLPTARYDGQGAIVFFDALQERLSRIPGVEAVGTASGSPFGSSITSLDFGIVGEPAPAQGEGPFWLVRWVGPGYFGALGIPLLRGRDVNRTDREGAPRVALVSRGAADRFFAGKDPIGQQFYFEDGGPVWTVVGVVGDVRSLDVAEAPEPEVYVPYPQWSRPSMTVLLRAGRRVSGLDAAIREEVRAMDPDLAIYDVGALEQAVASSTASQRFYLVLLGLFAGLAVLLAAVGLYGVVAYLVSGRTREIGIRIALGAHPADVVRMVAAQGAPAIAVGVLAGLGGALLGARALASLLYQIGPWDLPTFLGSTGLLVGVATLACLFPARRASRTSPTDAMRVE